MLDTSDMELEPIIGLEIHIQLKTKSKMFCGCANVSGDAPPNTAICPICLGYPGTLPVPNRQAIHMTQRVGAALNCALATRSKFDRKSYFYPDLPKGYQISQYDQPFCGKGSITLMIDNVRKTVGITRIHLEEDAAKNIHPAGTTYTLVDFNRAGTPLIEIVTEPDIRSPQEAKVFLQELQRVARVLEISDADMEKGQLRCDANISLRPVSSKASSGGEEAAKLYPKTEIKNINSFRFVEKALQYEIKRQTKEWEQGNIPAHATRGWKAEKAVTIEQRTKEEAADYRYFPEPDIPPFTFTEQELRQIYVDLPELPYAKRERLQRQYGISGDHVSVFVDKADLGNFFENAVSEIEQLNKEEVGIADKEVKSLVNLTANVIARQIRTIMERDNLTDEDLKITPANFAELIVLQQQGKIGSAAALRVLEEMQRTGGDPDHIVQNLGLQQEGGTAHLMRFIQHVIAANPDIVEKIKAGKESALQYLVGQVMARSEGKANPSVVLKLLQNEIMGGKRKKDRE